MLLTVLLSASHRAAVTLLTVLFTLLLTLLLTVLFAPLLTLLFTLLLTLPLSLCSACHLPYALLDLCNISDLLCIQLLQSIPAIWCVTATSCFCTTSKTTDS